MDSALIKSEDKALPRLRHHSQSHQGEKSATRRELQKLRLDRRKLTFSSDEDDEDAGITTITGQIDFNEDSTRASPAYLPEPQFGQDIEQESETIGPETPLIKKEESTEPPVKRRRGRPRKSEQEKKEKVVTRRSRRIVENPALRKHHALEQPALMLVPKPLRAFGLVPGGHSQVITSSTPGTLLLTQKPNGKQKPLTIDAERLQTASSRDKRFNLTTLDVLRQFVDEHNPRATKNETLNEQVVLDEFKAHLLYHVRHLMDLHASIRDISHDIAEVQRRKNETRKNILELKRKHAEVGIEISKVRKEYSDDKQSHAEFMAMVGAFTDLKSAVTSETAPGPNLSDKVNMELDNLTRIFDPREGIAVQLQAINAELTSIVENE